MIALDDQPFAIVEDEGFRQYSKGLEPRYKLPSEKYMRETAMPELYESVHKEVERRVAGGTVGKSDDQHLDDVYVF